MKITELHENSPKGLANSQFAMEHLVYLFKIRAFSKPLPREEMWLIDGKGLWARAHYLYMEPSNDPIHGVSMKEDPSCMRYTHPDYITLVDSENRLAWINWLVPEVGISDRPRFVEQGALSSALYDHSPLRL